MTHHLRGILLATSLAVAAGAMAQTPVDTAPGGTVDSLLALARERNPEFSAMRHEARAASERVLPAGALMDPRLKVELQDITKGGEQGATVLPSDVGATAYTLTQDLPWSGKRALKRDIATLEADGAQGRARQTWSELAARIKAVFAQRYLIQGSQRLVGESLDLMLQLEKVLQVRYATGLSAQQDITRIHVEHTAMRGELVALANEWRQTQSRLNLLLGRPADAALAVPQGLRAVPAPSQLQFAALSDRLRSANPQLFVESARVRSAEKSRDLAYKSRYPDFTLGVSAMQRQSAVKEWSLMLELNLPIRDSALQSQERESEAMLAAARARQEAAANQALAELADNLSALEAARQTEHLAVYSLLPQTDLTWRAALAGYENGKGDFAALLDAQRQIRQAKLNQLKAQVDAQMRLADIERLLGEDL
ncbi:MAG: TolC family protein [Burkholderiaceae bacterium]|nr:TolC family protein [Burkholderiaceae bacterium]